MIATLLRRCAPYHGSDHLSAGLTPRVGGASIPAVKDSVPQLQHLVDLPGGVVGTDMIAAFRALLEAAMLSGAA
jgi:hypothetical protein